MSIPDEYDDLTGTVGVLEDAMLGNALNGSEIKSISRDVGAYLRCRANGGGELICRFFGGLPPFTIGGLLIS